MNYFLHILCCFLMLFLSGCTTQPKNEVKGQMVYQCMATCVQHFEFCKKNCVNNCPACSAASTRRSVFNFTKFIHEKQVEGQVVTRELNSYRDPLQCRKVTCSCIADFMVCKQNCTGKIPKRIQAVPYCI